MSNLASTIESLEHRWMRAWIAEDSRTLKLLTSRGFRMLLGTRPCVILDAPSWLRAAAERFTCQSYRFGDVYVRKCGSVAIFATQLEMDASIGRQDLSGEYWITSVWSKAGVRRQWRMSERMVSRLDRSERVASALASLQLWR